VPERDESIQLIRHAFERGCTHFDTAEGYGAGDNEVLVGEALRPLRKQIRTHLDASLKRLGTDHVELYYLHRVNPNVPVEEVAGSMGKLIREGKILGWGLSQVTVEQIRRAHAVTPVTAVQSEYSMMERMFERDVIPVCKELNIGFVAFSPLASGFLSGKVSSEAQFQGDDVRRAITRFDGANMAANQPLLDLLQKFADAKLATAAQVSLAWMLAKSCSSSPFPAHADCSASKRILAPWTSNSPSLNWERSRRNSQKSQFTETEPTKTSQRYISLRFPHSFVGIGPRIRICSCQVPCDSAGLDKRS
jgi:aryl-alcohol dehydrogenase-like predicted oxidoreductase